MHKKNSHARELARMNASMEMKHTGFLYLPVRNQRWRRQIVLPYSNVSCLFACVCNSKGDRKSDVGRAFMHELLHWVVRSHNDSFCHLPAHPTTFCRCPETVTMSHSHPFPSVSPIGRLLGTEQTIAAQ